MKVSQEKLEEIVEYLRGSIMSLSTACVEFGYNEEDLTIEQLEYLDSEIFNCVGCGWWYEISENNDFDDEPHCDSCYEDALEEEEEEEE